MFILGGKVERRHSERWSTSFRSWASKVQPGKILASFLSHRRSSSVTSSKINYVHKREQTASETLFEAELRCLRPLTLIHGDFKVNNIFLSKQSNCSLSGVAPLLWPLAESDHVKVFYTRNFEVSEEFAVFSHDCNIACFSFVPPST
jgi:hypothetical protein